MTFQKTREENKTVKLSRVGGGTIHIKKKKKEIRKALGKVRREWKNSFKILAKLLDLKFYAF